MNERFSPGTPVMGVPAETVAGVLQALSGFFAGKCYKGLLGAAQAMRDMTESGLYGTGLERVLRYHFPPPKKRFHADCLRAVNEVFRAGGARDPAWRILSLRRAFFPIGDACRRGRPCGAPAGERLLLLGEDALGFCRGLRYYGVYRVPADGKEGAGDELTEEGCAENGFAEKEEA